MAMWPQQKGPGAEIGQARARRSRARPNGEDIFSTWFLPNEPNKYSCFQQMNMRLDAKNEGSIRQRIPSSTEMYWRTLVSNAGSALE